MLPNGDDHQLVAGTALDADDTLSTHPRAKKPVQISGNVQNYAKRGPATRLSDMLFCGGVTE